MSAPINHLHIALGVRDVALSAAFYTSLFGVLPDKVTEGYVRLVIADPPLVLSLNPARRLKGGDRLQHFGLRFASATRFAEVRDRLRSAGLVRKEQHRTECCHAIQAKVWVRDPDGNDWEFYDLIEDVPLPLPVVGLEQRAS